MTEASETVMAKNIELSSQAWVGYRSEDGGENEYENSSDSSSRGCHNRSWFDCSRSYGKSEEFVGDYLRKTKNFLTRSMSAQNGGKVSSTKQSETYRTETANNLRRTNEITCTRLNFFAGSRIYRSFVMNVRFSFIFLNNQSLRLKILSGNGVLNH